MNSKTIEEAEYAPLHRDSSDEHDESDTSVPITSTRRFPRTHGSRTPCVIAFALILFLFTACAMLSLRIKDLERKLRELKRKDNRVLPTDFKDAVRYLEYEDKVFTGLIASNVTSNGTEVYLDVPAGQPRYFGDPAIYPEIDTNWKDLLGNEFFSLSDEEAEPFPKENFLNMAAISVFHGLHCINAIRIHMDKDHYLLYGGLHQDGPGYPPNFSRVHMSHCLDHIRQQIQCSGDLSPVPLYQHNEIQVNGGPLSIAQGSNHTCRNFDRIKLWMVEREMYGNSIGEYPES